MRCRLVVGIGSIRVVVTGAALVLRRLMVAVSVRGSVAAIFHVLVTVTPDTSWTVLESSALRDLAALVAQARGRVMTVTGTLGIFAGAAKAVADVNATVATAMTIATNASFVLIGPPLGCWVLHKS